MAVPNPTELRLGEQIRLVGYSVDGGAVNTTPPVVVLNNANPTRAVTVHNDPHVEVLGTSATSGTLPFTGSQLPRALTFLAATLLAIGAIALALSERRRRFIR